MDEIRKIRLFKPFVGEEELENIREVFRRAWLGLGPLVDEFEGEWSSYIGRRHSVGVNSCTAALHLALNVPQFPAGKKVLVPAITFVSTAHAALYNGLEPVFVDVDSETLSIDIEDLERKITPDCVAVIPVHLGGHPVPMDKLLPVAKRHGLLVIEDCANCAGGSFKGKKLGSWGDIGCFSFEEKKSMTTGDGGFICLDDDQWDKQLRALRWVGIDRDTWKRAQLGQDIGTEEARHWYYEVSTLGYKYHMTDLAAAIGLAQLKKLDWMNRRRAELIERYLEGLADARLVRPAFPYQLEESAYWLFAVRAEPGYRDRLMVYLRAHGVATGVHFMPLPLHPLYKKYDNGVEISKRVWNDLITLPLFPELKEEEVDYVLQMIRDFEDSV